MTALGADWDEVAAKVHEAWWSCRPCSLVKASGQATVGAAVKASAPFLIGHEPAGVQEEQAVLGLEARQVRPEQALWGQVAMLARRGWAAGGGHGEAPWEERQVRRVNQCREGQAQSAAVNSKWRVIGVTWIEASDWWTGSKNR